MLYTPPEKRFPVVCDGDLYRAMVAREGGRAALEQWMALEAAMKPLQTGAASFPAAAIRSDIGALPARRLRSVRISAASCIEIRPRPDVL